MRSVALLVIAISVGIVSFSQPAVKLEELADHAGDSVRVCGRVTGVRFLENAKNQPVFINMGMAYPNQLLTVVIWGDHRKQFDKTPEEFSRTKRFASPAA